MKEILVLVAILIVYFYFFTDKKDETKPEQTKPFFGFPKVQKDKASETQIVPENAK